MTTTTINPMLVIRPEGDLEVVPLTADQSKTYAALREHVDGYLEAVYMPGATMFVDEEGKLTGKEPNLLATRVLAYARGFDLGEGTLADCYRVCGDVIAGNAVIIGNDGSPETVGLAPDVLDLLLAKASGV